MMKHVLFLFALAYAAGCCFAPAFAEKPNIILILSDDMGYSDLGCFGSEINTPNLDTLAAGGIRFTQFYNTARCCPTRASLLTGLHPHQAGMGHMTGAGHRGLPGYAGDLLPTTVTIAEAVKPAGYRNYAVGKWHVTDQTRADGSKHNWPLQRGFDRYYGIIHGAANYFDPPVVRDNTVISPFNDPEYKPEKDYYLTTALSDQASRFITEHKQQTPDEPFFMYLAFTAAHWPMQVPEELAAKYKGKYDAGYTVIREARYEKQKALGLIKPEWQLSPQAEDWDAVKDKHWEARCMEVYAAMITELDRGIGQVVDTLKKTGQYDNTVILFLQDNGACAENVGRTPQGKYTERPAQPVFEAIAKEKVFDDRKTPETQTREGFPVIRGKGVLPGPKDTYIAYGRGWANVSDTPFREYKHWVHEGGISTPLIVHSPKQIAEKQRGQFYREPGQLPDVHATIVELAGAVYPKEYNGHQITPAEGTSLVPALTGQHLNRSKPLVWEHEGNRAVREDNWKLVAKGPLGTWELYDMDKDRSELNNLAEQYPDKVKDLAAKWHDWAVRAKVLPWPWQKPETAAGAADKTPGVKLDLNFSGKPRYFNGNSHIDVEKSPALSAAQTPWKVEAEIESESPEGVIIAYGGTRHGYSLFLSNGKPGFAIRLNDDIFAVYGNAPVKGKTVLRGEITAQKKIELYVDGKQVAAAKIPDFIQEEPVEGLQIGADLGGKVSGLDDAPDFKGWISRIILERVK
ncbi:MAG: arylsulfatase [Planctomycetaceae bacterium]|jgi:arylsulfatase|nr:arylsulfatase [Planctomycetaceae bacterium]